MIKINKDINKYPHCSEFGIGFWQKSFLGPANSTKCKLCNKNLSVTYYQSFIIVLVSYMTWFILIKLLAGDEILSSIFIGISIIMFIISIILNWYFVPLIPKDDTPDYDVNEFLKNL